MGLKFTKGDVKIEIPFNNIITEEKYISFNKKDGGGTHYINLTQNIEETNFPKIKFIKDNITYYAKTKYNFGTVYNKNYDSLGWGGNRGLKETVLNAKHYGKFKKVSGTSKIQVGHVQHRQGNFYVRVFGYNDADKQVYDSGYIGHLSSYSASRREWASVNWAVELPEQLRIVITVDGNTGDPESSNSGGDNTIDIAQVTNVLLQC